MISGRQWDMHVCMVWTEETGSIIVHGSMADGRGTRLNISRMRIFNPKKGMRTYGRLDGNTRNRKRAPAGGSCQALTTCTGPHLRPRLEGRGEEIGRIG